MVVGIFGVGAIGGSIGLRARENGDLVVGCDSDASALQAAKAAGAIDEAAGASALQRRADVLVIAAHLEETLEEIARLRGEIGALPELIVDVSSVKAPIVRAAHGLENFVATHPMAGTERGGAGAARADLFVGRPWAYVPSGKSELDARARSFIESLGGIAIPIGAEEHDRVVAIVSHVPQVLAYCFARLVQEGGDDAERLCGPVARELLRISKMSPHMWQPILAANAANVKAELQHLCADLSAAAQELQ
jgi:prephenate dehydrogenase